MAEAIICPHCRHAFRYKPELVGKRIKCPHCAESFIVQAPTPAAPPAPNRFQSPEPEIPLAAWSETESTPPSVPSMPPTARPQRRAPQPWTDKQRFALRVGWMCIAFGALSMVLPLFGLQFRKLERLGDDAWKAGLGVMGLGVLLCGGAALRRYLPSLRLFRFVAYLAGGGAALIVILIVLAFALGGRGRSPARPNLPSPNVAAPGPNRSAPPSRRERSADAPRPSQAQRAAQDARPGATPRAERDSLPGQGSRSAQASRPSLAGRPERDPWPAYASVVRQHGENAVVRIEVANADARTHGAVSRWFVEAFPRDLHPTRMISMRQGTLYVVAAPFKDLDALVKQITFGKVKSVDAEQRIIHVEAGE